MSGLQQAADVDRHCHRVVTAEHFQLGSTATCGDRCAETTPEASTVFSHQSTGAVVVPNMQKSLSASLSLLISMQSVPLIHPSTHSSIYPSLFLFFVYLSSSHSWGLTSWFIYEL